MKDEGPKMMDSTLPSAKGNTCPCQVEELSTDDSQTLLWVGSGDCSKGHEKWLEITIFSHSCFCSAVISCYGRVVQIDNSCGHFCRNWLSCHDCVLLHLVAWTTPFWRKKKFFFAVNQRLDGNFSVRLSFSSHIISSKKLTALVGLNFFCWVKR